MVEKRVRCLSCLVFFMSAIIAAPLYATLAGNGLYLRYGTAFRLEMIERWHMLTSYAVCGVGVAGVMFHSYLAYFHLDVTRNKLDRAATQIFRVCGAYVSTILLFILGVVIMFILITDNMLEDFLHHGIRGSMIKYSVDRDTKYRVDQIQIHYKCCGSTSFTNWFTVPWIIDDDVAHTRNTPTALSLSLSDNVPFSCCNVSSKRPCVHYHVSDNDYHYHFHYRKQSTLNRDGCLSKLKHISRAWSQVLLTLFGAAFALEVLELFLVGCLYSLIWRQTLVRHR